MISADHFRERIIIPTLTALAVYDARMNSEAAIELLMGTAAQESDLGYFLVQTGGGPGLGVFSMEQETHTDVLRYLNRPDKRSLLEVVEAISPTMSEPDLVGNLFYATAMARIKYWMQPEALPDDLDGWASYYKTYFNTASGAATEEEFINSYNEFVL